MTLCWLVDHMNDWTNITFISQTNYIDAYDYLHVSNNSYRTVTVCQAMF